MAFRQHRRHTGFSAPPRRSGGALLWLVLLLIAGAGGGWLSLGLLEHPPVPAAIERPIPADRLISG